MWVSNEVAESAAGGSATFDGFGMLLILMGLICGTCAV